MNMATDRPSPKPAPSPPGTAKPSGGMGAAPKTPSAGTAANHPPGQAANSALGKPVGPGPAKPGLGAPSKIQLSAFGKGTAPNPGQPASSRVTLSKGSTKVGINFKAQQRKEEEAQKAKEEAEAKVPLEMRVFGIPGMKEIVEPEIFIDFVEKVAPKLQLGNTSWAIIEAFSNIDVTAERVSQVIRGNPYYESVFKSVVEGMAKREEMPSLEGSIVLVGMQNFRNFVIALQMLRSVTGLHPEWDKDGKLKLNPADSIRYALKTEELLLSGKSEYSDTAYAAGLVYDVLAAAINAISDDKKKVLAYLDAVYAHGLRTAQIGMELANLVPDMGFRKYVFSACLIHDVGKIGISLVRPAYVNFVEESKKKEWPRPVRQFTEIEKWGVDHTVIGALVCHAFKIFRPIEKVIQFHHDPYLLKSRNKNLYQLASLVSLATNIANNFKKTDRLDDPVVATWKGTELRDFKIEMHSVLDVVSKVQI